ncbi:AMP-binding protein [Rhodobacteraceae bacterium]|nr:AMP-binding protein [Paracoccaceae bacterium]
MGDHKNGAECANRIDQALKQAGPFATLVDCELTRDDLRKSAIALAHKIASMGFARGVRVFVATKSEQATIIAITTTLRMGHTLIVGDAQATPDATAALIAHSQPDIVVSDVNLFAGTETLPVILADSLTLATSDTVFPERANNDVALIVFTSATTSRPKAVELTYDNLAAQFQIFADVYGFDGETRLLNLLPLHHVDGLVRGPISALWFGSALLRPRTYSLNTLGDILSDVARTRATHFITVPAVLRAIDRFSESHGDAFQSTQFRFILSSADHLDGRLWQRIEDRFRVPVANAYGLSEVVCDALIAGPDDATRKVGTIGRAYGVEAHVVNSDGTPAAKGEVGELVLAGPTVMRGYVGDAEAFRKAIRDGRFHTGDLVRCTEDDLFEFVGRVKNVVVVGGATIYPEAIGEVLLTMTGVGEAYAFGLSDDVRGERLVAAMSPEPGLTLDESAIWAEARARLAPEQYPAEIVFFDRLPRNATGKVQRDAIIQKVEDAGNDDAHLNVFEIAARCFKQPLESLSSASSPFNTGGWDSLAHLEFIEELESTYGIMLSPVDIASLMTLSDAIEITDNARK